MKRLITICLICLTVQIAEAAVIFDNGAPNGQGGNEVTYWIQSEDFALEQPEVLTDCHFWTVEGYGNGGGNPWDGTLQYWVFADNGGSPGAIIDSGYGQDIVRTATGGAVLEGFNEFTYDFNLQQPVPLAADNIYWIGLHLASDYQNRDEIYWETTSPGWGSTGRESYLGTMDNWFDNGQQHAFYLTTPEPTTICLLGLGALSLLRRKKH